MKEVNKLANTVLNGRKKNKRNREQSSKEIIKQVKKRKEKE
jgi:hypothetical protein